MFTHSHTHARHVGCGMSRCVMAEWLCGGSSGLEPVYFAVVEYDSFMNEVCYIYSICGIVISVTLVGFSNKKNHNELYQILSCSIAIMKIDSWTAFRAEHCATLY